MSGSVRIKFCGIRSVEDADAAVEAGADLIGLNFVSGSRREVDIRVAEEICERIERFGLQPELRRLAQELGMSEEKMRALYEAQLEDDGL